MMRLFILFLNLLGLSTIVTVGVAEAAEASTAIIVESATYGDLASQDPARIRDVKTKVERALRKGDGRFTVAAMAEGDDPCYGTVKTLKVNCRVSGRSAHFTGTDPETADLLKQE